MTPEDIPHLMDRVVGHLRRLGRRVPDLLQDPLSKEELQLWAAKFPFSMTRELDAIYSWRNGTRARDTPFCVSASINCPLKTSPRVSARLFSMLSG